MALLRRLLALPVFVVVGGFAGSLLSYGSNAEDLASPSRLVTVMGVWERGGRSLCRAFGYQELRPHLDTLQVRFALAPADVERCRTDFAAYGARDGWPMKLREREPAWPGYSFEVEETDPLRIMVHRSSGDPGSWAETHYTVTTDGSLTDVTTDSASNGQGLGIMLGAFAGMVAWLCWVVVSGAGAALRKRREGST